MGELSEGARPVRVAIAQRFEAAMQRLVTLARRGCGEMRGADRARPLEARLQPAPQAERLRLAAELMERDEHAAQVVVAGGRKSGPEADQHLRFLLERVADEPALDGVQSRLRVAAQRIVRADHQAAESLARHAT